MLWPSSSKTFVRQQGRLWVVSWKRWTFRMMPRSSSWNTSERDHVALRWFCTIEGWVSKKVCKWLHFDRSCPFTKRTGCHLLDNDRCCIVFTMYQLIDNIKFFRDHQLPFWRRQMGLGAELCVQSMTPIHVSFRTFLTLDMIWDWSSCFSFLRFRTTIISKTWKLICICSNPTRSLIIAPTFLMGLTVWKVIIDVFHTYVVKLTIFKIHVSSLSTDHSHRFDVLRRIILFQQFLTLLRYSHSFQLLYQARHFFI